MNIVIVGNCQSRPLASFLTEMAQSVECGEPIIAHLAKDENQQEDLQRLTQADLILSQPIDKNFRVKHISTNNLRDQFSDKLLVWPNMFFSGQCPDLFSATILANGQKLQGPLETYHVAGIFNAWKNGWSTDETINRLSSELCHRTADIDWVAEFSLHSLQQRENDTDISVSDVIETHFKSRKLFHVFNHPTSFLMLELCKRICSYSGIDIVNSEPLAAQIEPLGRLAAPMTQPMAQHLGLSYASNDTATGREISIDGNSVVLGNPCNYTFSELVIASFAAYNAQSDVAADVQCTPAYVSPLLNDTAPTQAYRKAS